MKVKITGSVFNGHEYLTGIVDLPEDDALALVNSGHAELVESESKIETQEEITIDLKKKKNK